MQGRKAAKSFSELLCPCVFASLEGVAGLALFWLRLDEDCRYVLIANQLVERR